MADLRLPFRAHLRMVLQQLQGQANQIVEINALVGGQALFIARHDACRNAFVIVFGLGLGHRCVEAHVFPQADGPLPLAGRGRVRGAAGVFEQTGHIIAVQNTELWFEAHGGTVLAQDANTQRMKGTNRDFLRCFANELFGPLAHFSRCFIGEGDGGDGAGVNPRLDQQGQFVGDDAGFARARTGQDQARALQYMDRFELCWVQTG